MSKKFTLLILALLMITICFTIKFYVEYDEINNKMSLIGLRIKPMEYIIEYRYKEGKKIGKSIRHKDFLKLVYFDSLGEREQIVEKTIGVYPVVRTKYHKNGNIKSVAELMDTIRHGTLELYNENGDLIENRLYKHDHLLMKTSENGTLKELYPYIKVDPNLNNEIITINVDFNHIDISKYDTINFHYDFSEDSLNFYKPRYVERIDTSEVRMQFERNSLEEFKIIYGFIELDGKEQVSFAQQIFFSKG